MVVVVGEYPVFAEWLMVGSDWSVGSSRRGVCILLFFFSSILGLHLHRGRGNDGERLEILVVVGAEHVLNVHYSLFPVLLEVLVGGGVLVVIGGELPVFT